jgi:hypothetical protein
MSGGFAPSKPPLMSSVFHDELAQCRQQFSLIAQRTSFSREEGMEEAGLRQTDGGLSIALRPEPLGP